MIISEQIKNNELVGKLSYQKNKLDFHEGLVQSRTNNVKTPKFSSSNLLNLTKTWDKGSKTIRQKILAQLVEKLPNATGPELEKEFGNGASLILLRISAWLRLTYLLGSGGD